MLSNRLSSRLSIENNDRNNNGIPSSPSTTTAATTTTTTPTRRIMLNRNSTMHTPPQAINYDDLIIEERSLQDIFEISDSSLFASSTRSLSPTQRVAAMKNATSSTNQKLKTNSSNAGVGASGPSLPSHHRQPNPWCLLFLLNVVAIIWGTQHPIIKIVVDSESDFGDGMTGNDVHEEEHDSSASTSTQGILTNNNNNDSASPALSVLLRFAIAAILSTPSILCCYRHRGGRIQHRQQQQQQPSISKIWRWGFELGVYLTLGFALQAVALTITTAQRSGFLLYLNVKFVPLFGWLFGGKSISVVTWISALVALVGTALLTLGGQDTIPFNVGDLLAIGSAITSALFIWRLEVASSNLKLQQPQTPTPSQVVGDGPSTPASKQNITTKTKTFSEEETFDNSNISISTFQAFESPDSKGDDEKDGIMMNNQQQHYHSHGSGSKAAAISALLHSTTMWCVTLGCLIWTVGVQITTRDFNYVKVVFPDLIQNHLWEIVYLGTIPTALCNYLQTYAQRFVSSEKATLVYSMDPVYGAIASYLLLGETLGNVWGYIGAILIFLASLTGVLFPSSSSSPTSSDGDDDDDVYAPFLSSDEEDFEDEPDATTRQRRRDDSYLQDTHQQLYDDDLELYPGYHNWIEGWGALIGIGLAIISFGCNIYAAAVVLLDDPNEAGDDETADRPLSSLQSAFIIYACVLAASLSLWVALREMKLVLNGYEEDSWTKYRLLQELAKEEDDHRKRLILRLEVATKREYVLMDAYRQIQRMIPTYADIATRSTISNLIQQSKDVQAQRESQLCKELIEQIMEYAVQKSLPIFANGRSGNNDGDDDDDDDDENWILKYLEESRPDVTINHQILSKKRKRYNKSKHKHQSEKRIGLVLILMRDIVQTSSESTASQSSKKRRKKRIIEISV